ncbi:MAG: hypothetical protein K2M67_08400 [Muribaculaceae bacterium]|nr:hypothetical protein [Muribaculaceae bacterium]
MSFKSLSTLISRNGLRLLPALIALLICIGAGCSHSNLHTALLEAESVIEDDADSAYAILSDLKIDSTTPEEDRALYSLLLTQAMHKTHRLDIASEEIIDAQSSMIDYAIDYFDKHNSGKHAMKSYFYRGILLCQKTDSIIYALEPFYSSLDIALVQKDTFWIARNYDLISGIYYSQNAYYDYTQAQQLALSYYKLTDKQDFINFSRYSFAYGLYLIGKHEEAIAEVDTLLSILSANESSSLRVRSLNTRARALFYCDRFKECAEQIEKLDSMGAHQPDLVLFHAGSYIEMDKPDMAKKIMKERANDLDSTDRNMLANLFYRKDPNASEGYKAMDTLYSGLAKDYVEMTQGNLNTIQSIIHRNIAYRHNLEKENLNLKYLLCGIILAIILIAFLLWNLKRKRDQAATLARIQEDFRAKKLQWKEEYERMNADSEKRETAWKEKLERNTSDLEKREAEWKDKLERTSSDLEKREAEWKDLSQMRDKMEKDINEIASQYGLSIPANESEPNVKGLLSSMIEKVKKLSDEEVAKEMNNLGMAGLGYIRMVSEIMMDIQYEDSIHGDKNSRITDRIVSLKSYLDSFRPDSEELALRATLIDELRNNAIHNLQTGADGVPKVKGKVLNIAIYLFYGLNTDTISFLLKIKQGHVYTLKSRLRKTLTALPEDMKAIYAPIMEG